MRKETLLNNDWFFTKTEQNGIPNECDERWEKVTIPHTWNALDGQDGNADYYRGMCCYLKEFDMKKEDGTRYYLRFGAAASVCAVYLNGTLLTTHIGGYSAFCVDITDAGVCGTNTLVCKVTNERRSDVYPQMADFTFYGGIHRGVKLISVPSTHFDLTYYAGIGVMAVSELTGKKSALLKLNSYIKNAGASDTVRYTVLTMSGEIKAEIYRPAELAETEIELRDISLWHGVRAPYLYTVKAELIRGNEVLDCVSLRHGFRKFEADAQKGFILNGEPYPLRGVSRHQDRAGIGNALLYEHHMEDAELIKEIGANAVRLSHYQHSEDFLNLCDELGFIVWAEIPFISKFIPGAEAQENTLSQMQELIVQCHHHSSICFWGISNEITIGGEHEDLTRNLKKLNDLCHKEDPTRLTVMAQVSPLPIQSEHNKITDLVAYNHYFGWYGGELEDNERWLDRFHSEHPDIPLGISEYGAEGIITYLSDEPKAGDYTEAYQALYHEHMLKIFSERPWLFATYVWNMFDFGCDARDEGGVSGRNNKGLVSLDRRIKKDAFYLYKANWTNAPVIHICGKKQMLRDSEKVNIKVYSNTPSVTLKVNGTVLKELAQGDSCVFEFCGVTLSEGINEVCAVFGDCKDTAYFQKTASLPEYYTLKTEDDGGKVENWFDSADLSSVSENIEDHDPAFFSVHDSIRQILQNDLAADILVGAIRSLSGMNVKRSQLMIMSEQTPYELFSGSMLPQNVQEYAKKALAVINNELQKIKH